MQVCAVLRSHSCQHGPSRPHSQVPGSGSGQGVEGGVCSCSQQSTDQPSPAGQCSSVQTAPAVLTAMQGIFGLGSPYLEQVQPRPGPQQQLRHRLVSLLASLKGRGGPVLPCQVHRGPGGQ